MIQRKNIYTVRTKWQLAASTDSAEDKNYLIRAKRQLAASNLDGPIKYLLQRKRQLTIPFDYRFFEPLKCLLVWVQST